MGCVLLRNWQSYQYKTHKTHTSVHHYTRTSVLIVKKCNFRQSFVVLSVSILRTWIPDGEKRSDSSDAEWHFCRLSLQRRSIPCAQPSACVASSSLTLKEHDHATGRVPSLAALRFYTPRVAKLCWKADSVGNIKGWSLLDLRQSRNVIKHVGLCCLDISSIEGSDSFKTWIMRATNCWDKMKTRSHFAWNMANMHLIRDSSIYTKFEKQVSDCQ